MCAEAGEDKYGSVRPNRLIYERERTMNSSIIIHKITLLYYITTVSTWFQLKGTGLHKMIWLNFQSEKCRSPITRSPLIVIRSHLINIHKALSHKLYQGHQGHLGQCQGRLAISLICMSYCYIILRIHTKRHLANRPLNWYDPCNFSE